MSKRCCWLSLACLLMVAAGAWAADPPLALPAGSGLVDPAKRVPAAQAKLLAQACDKLASERSAHLLVVIEPKPGTPRTAETLLRQWPAAAKDALAAVLQITFETSAADLALSPSLAESLPDSVRANLLEARVKPALSPHVADRKLALAEALVHLAGQIGESLPEPASSPAKVAQMPPPPPPPLWRHPAWWVLAPTLLLALILAARQGAGAALAWLPPLLLLYSGLYLMLRFEPRLLAVCGVLAFVPIAIVRAQAPVRRAIRGAMVRCGGFGCSLSPQRRGGF